jgi:hypothetical protein
LSNIGHEKLHQSDHDIYTSNKGDKYEPTPQKNVDFLVDNVHGQYTQGINNFNRSRTSIFVKITFGHSWKYFGHGVHTVFCLHISKVKDLKNTFIKKIFWVQTVSPFALWFRQSEPLCTAKED